MMRTNKTTSFTGFNVQVANNGYSVRVGDNSCGFGNPYVFETFESMVKWMKENLAEPQE